MTTSINPLVQKLEELQPQIKRALGVDKALEPVYIDVVQVAKGGGEKYPRFKKMGFEFSDFSPFDEAFKAPEGWKAVYYIPGQSNDVYAQTYLRKKRNDISGETLAEQVAETAIFDDCSQEIGFRPLYLYYQTCEYVTECDYHLTLHQALKIKDERDSDELQDAYIESKNSLRWYDAEIGKERQKVLDFVANRIAETEGDDTHSLRNMALKEVQSILEEQVVLMRLPSCEVKEVMQWWERFVLENWHIEFENDMDELGFSGHPDP